MNGQVIAIYLTETELRAAVIDNRNGAPVIHGIYRSAAKPFDPAKALEGYVDRLSSRDHQAVLIVPSEDLVYNEFSFPFSSSRKVENAIAFEISSGENAENYVLDHIKSLSREAGLFRFISAQADRGRLQEKTRIIQKAGLRLIGITADISILGLYFQEQDEALVMDIGEKSTLFALYNQGIPVLFRTVPIGVEASPDNNGDRCSDELNRLSGEIRRTVHSFNTKAGVHLERVWLTGNLLANENMFEKLGHNLHIQVDIKKSSEFGAVIQDHDLPYWDFNVFSNILGAAFWNRKSACFSLMKEEFTGRSREKSGGLIRWVSIGGGLLVLTFFLSLVLANAVLQKRHDFLSDEIRKTFSSAFPQVTRVVDEVKQARNLLNSRRLGSMASPESQGRLGLLDVLNTISSTVPDGTYFQVINMFWETGKMEIQARTDSFKTVNEIQELLGRTSDFSEVTISNARLREDTADVEFKLTIKTG